MKAHTYLHESAFRPHKTSELVCAETAPFWNRTPERGFMAPYTRLRIKICGFQNARIRVDMALIDR